MTYEQMKKQRSRLYETFARYALDVMDLGGDERLDPDRIEAIRRHAAETKEEIRAIDEQINAHLDKIADRAARNLQ